MRTVIRWSLRGLVFLALMGALLAFVFWERLERLYRVNTLFDEDRIVSNFSSMETMFLTANLTAGEPRPLAKSPQTIAKTFTHEGQTETVADWIERTNMTALVVLKDGKIAHEAYLKGTKAEDTRISWSVAKSFLSALFGILMEEGSIASLDDPVTKYAPELAGSAYDGVPIRYVLTMSSGVTFNEDYLDFNSDINKMGRVLALGRSMDGFAAALSDRTRPPGEARQYVSIDTHVIGMVIRGATGRDVVDLLEEKVIAPIGTEGPHYYLTDGRGSAFVLGGLNMRTRDYARFGQMMLENGRVGDTQIVPEDWVAESTVNIAPESATGRVWGYGYQWWVPPGGAEGEFLARGIYDQYIYINRNHGVVIAVNSANRRFREGGDATNLKWVSFFRALSAGLAGSPG